MKLLGSRIKLLIPERIFEILMYWINKAPGEVSGIGNILQDKKNPHIYRVTAAVLAKQTNTGATTESEGDAHGEALFRLHKQPGVARWYWHSHSNFGVFWSGTDQENMCQFDKDGFTFETVINRKREMLTAYVQAKPFIAIDEVPCSVESEFQLTVADVRFCEREYKTNILPPLQTSLWRPDIRHNSSRSADDSALADDDFPSQVYWLNGYYWDLKGHRYSVVKDEEGYVWLKGEAFEFPLEDVEDVTDDIEFEPGRGRSVNGDPAISGPTETNLRVTGRADTAVTTDTGANCTIAKPNPDAAGGTDTAARSEDSGNGGGGRGDRLIHYSSPVQDGVRERARVRS